MDSGVGVSTLLLFASFPARKAESAGGDCVALGRTNNGCLVDRWQAWQRSGALAMRWWSRTGDDDIPGADMGGVLAKIDGALEF